MQLEENHAAIVVDVVKHVGVVDTGAISEDRMGHTYEEETEERMNVDTGENVDEDD